MSASRALQLGRDIGSYRLIRLLGEGGMGVVYEVVHQGIGRRAAMKFLTLDTRSHPDLATRFVNEARAANRISHPGVVQVYEFGQIEDGTPWMLMEFLDGETLSERLRKFRKAGQVFGRDGILLLHQLTSVLHAAHERGIVHRALFAPTTTAARFFQRRVSPSPRSADSGKNRSARTVAWRLRRDSPKRRQTL